MVLLTWVFMGTSGLYVDAQGTAVFFCTSTGFATFQVHMKESQNSELFLWS